LNQLQSIYMKNKLALIAVVAAVAAALSPSVQAVPITGVIGFSGTAQLDGSSVGTSTQVISWGADNVTGIANGSFAGLSGSPVTLAAPWLFNSGSLSSFWAVGGFTFNLASSTVFLNSQGFLSILLTGTVVSGNPNFDATAFTGRVTIQDPSTGNGRTFNYTESLSFQSVPDGGTTVLLLGAALSGLALLKRKLAA
jgi:hypothetical protein